MPTVVALERELGRIAGVSSVRVTVANDGRVGAVHAVASGCLPEDVARDIRSVTLAEYGLTIGADVVSVVSLDRPRRVDLVAEEEADRRDGQDAPESDEAPTESARRGAPSPVSQSSGRERRQPTLERVAAQRTAREYTTEVVLRCGDDLVAGKATGLPVDRSVYRTLGEATIEALNRADPASLGAALDRVALISVEGVDVAVATLVFVSPSRERSHVGVALVRRGREQEAVVEAVLDAARRELRRSG